MSNKQKGATMGKSILTDEIIIAALFSCKTQGQAAEQLGISSRQLYERMQDDHFKALYNDKRAELLRETIKQLADLQQKALAVYDDILTDKNAEPALKLKAADNVIKHFAAISAALDTREGKVQHYEFQASAANLLDFKL